MRGLDQRVHGSRESVSEVATPPLDGRAVARLAVSADPLAAVFVEMWLCGQARPGTVFADENRAVDELWPDR